MDENKINRINELARKAKTVGLTPEEKEEQTELRTRFIASFRANLKSQLDTIKIQKEDGTLVDLKERHRKKYGN